MKRPIVWFLLLAYGISWAIFAVGKWMVGVNSALGWTVTSALFMFGPAAAALILRKRLGFTRARLGLTFQGIRWKWMGIALVLALSMPVLTLAINHLGGDMLGIPGFGHAEVSKAMLIRTLQERMTEGGMTPGAAASSLDQLAALPLGGVALLAVMLLVGALVGGTVNGLFAMGEELGWRGMLYGQTRAWGLWQQTGFTGVVWGLWHTPLILEGHNYPDHPQWGVALMCLTTLSLAGPMAWVRRRAGSVLAPALMHGAVNGSAGIVLVFTSGATDLLGGPAGISAVLAMAVLLALLRVFDPLLPREFREG
jgi:membrane protease YdiL (CAAX protease family)